MSPNYPVVNDDVWPLPITIISPDMLLLDEPTNHLDAESVAWLERYLQNFQALSWPSPMIATFSIMQLQWILELDRGEGIPYEGNYSSWLEQKEQRLIMEGKQQAAHERTVKAELEWVRNNPKGVSAQK